MPKYFLTKTWGFSPETHPVLGFNDQGRLRNFLKASNPDDWVLIVGTKGGNTSMEQRGRLLGKCRLGRTEINTEATLNAIGTPISDEDRNRDGSYKWPNGLPMVEAHWFAGSPDISELFGTYLFGLVWAVEAREIDEHIGPDSSVIIDQLATTPAKNCDAPEIRKHRAKNAALLLTGQTGPGPSKSRSGSETNHKNGYSYLFKLAGKLGVGSPVFKIGYSNAPERRLAELNRGLLSSVTGYSWEILREQKFPNLIEAFTFEQLLHKRLQVHRVDGEREVYRAAEKEVKSAWNNVFVDAEWAMLDVQQQFSKVFETEERGY